MDKGKSVMKTFIQNRKGLKMCVLVEESAGQKGLAFIMHGLGGFKEQPHLAALGEILKVHNYTVATFDTTNSFGESEGKFEDVTFQGVYEDLVDLINWSKKEKWYQEPFVLIGHSLGGYCVARYAEENPSVVKAVFPFAAGIAGELIYKKLYDEEFLRKWKETGWKIAEHKVLPGVMTRLPWSYMEEMQHHDLRPKAGNLTMPVLLVVGEKDLSCPRETQKIFYDLIPGPKEMHVIHDAPHTFTDAKYIEETRAIFDSWLKKYS
jgi:pimeloyl-ACP methyl ester carboxylesterase